MNCLKTLEVLSEYVDGILDDDIKQEVKRHLDVCSSCRQEYELMTSIIGNLHQWEEEDLPDDFHHELHERLKTETAGKPGRSRFVLMRRYYTAAAAVLILVVSFSMLMNSGMLNPWSQKKSSSAENAAMDRHKAEGEEADDYGFKAAGKEPESVDNAAEEQPLNYALNADMSYRMVTINLNEEQYKKQYQDIVMMIEGYEGYIEKKDMPYYIMPDKYFEAFMDKLQKDYTIGSVSVAMVDMSEQYANLQAQITDMERGQENTPDYEGNDENEQMDEKKNEFKELEARTGHVLIQINRI